MDVKAKYIFELTDFAMFPKILETIKKEDLPFVVLGQGSDVLFTEDYNGVVIINKLKGMEFSEDLNYYFVKLQAGENFHVAIETCMKRGIHGLENLALIPGTAGGAPIQNFGAYGVSFSDFCRYVEVLDLKDNKLDRIWAKDCDFGYRTSVFKSNPDFKNRYIVTAVELKIPKEWTPRTSYNVFKNKEFKTPKEIFDFVCQIRQEKLPNPKDIPNAGSFFKNPYVSKDVFEKLIQKFPTMPYFETNDAGEVKIAAGWLIDKAGCKGLKMGNAGTYEKQALVLVNYGDATPQEILQVAKFVQNKVQETFGVLLEPEVRIYGSTTECQVNQ